MRLASRLVPPPHAGTRILHCDRDALHAAAPLCCAIGVKDERFSPMKSRTKERTPTPVNLTVKRRYLTEREVERLMDCARKHGRYGHRDATMMLVAYRHGLRASEVCALQWQQIELSEGRLHVHRVKNGIPSVHPIRGDEMRALRKLRRDYLTDAHIFVSERGGPISPRLPPAYPAPRGSRQDAISDPPAHASPRLRVQAGQRWPRHAGPAALPWAQEHPTHGQVYRNGARQVQRLLEGLTMAGPARGPSPLCGKLALSARHACRRGDKSCDHVRGRPFLVLHTRGPIAVSASIISRFGLRFVGSSVASSAASGDGPLGAGSAAGSTVPSMTFAASPARAASMVWMASMACSISSSVICFMRFVCSICSRGTSKTSILRNIAG